MDVFSVLKWSKVSYVSLEIIGYNSPNSDLIIFTYLS